MTDQINLFEGLSDGYEKQRLRPDEDFTMPLRDASFRHTICGTNYASFDDEYIKRLKVISGGDLRRALEAKLKSYPSTGYNRSTVYLNEYEVDSILIALEYYADNKEWKDSSKEDV